MPKSRDRSKGRIHIPLLSDLVASVQQRFHRQPSASANKDNAAQPNPTTSSNTMDGSDLSPFPKYEYSKLNWTHDKETGITSRPLGGPEYVETLWNHYEKGDQNLFFGTYIDLLTPVSDNKLKSAARDTWEWLRFHIPTIASKAGFDQNGNGILIYNTAKTQKDVNDWIARTFIEEKADKIDLDELRVRLGPTVVPDEHGDQTWIHIVTSGSTNITKFGLLLHTDHTPFDGSAIKKIFNRYLGRLAKALGPGGAPTEILKWGSEAANIAPSCFTILSPTANALPIPPTSSAVPKNSDPYYAALGKCMSTLATMGQTAYGFKPIAKDEGTPITKRERLLFTKEETDLLLKKLKSSTDINKGYTVAQLTHAALCMVTVADNPPTAETPEGLSMSCFGLVDGTSLLAEPWSSRDAYPGYSLSAAPVKFPLSLFRNSDGTAAPLNKETFLRALKYSRDIYTEQKNDLAILSIMAQAADMFTAGLKAALEAKVLPPNQGFSISNDGRGETYLDPTFFDSNGKAMFEVTEFFTSLNRTNPAGFFRVSSWKGIIEIGVDANTNIVSPEISKQRLDLWKKYIFLIKDLNESDYD